MRFLEVVERVCWPSLLTRRVLLENRIEIAKIAG